MSISSFELKDSYILAQLVTLRSRYMHQGISTHPSRFAQHVVLLSAHSSASESHP